MPQLFMSPDGFPKEGQPLFWSTRPHPPNRAREPRRPSVRLARRGSKEERNKKFPRPRQSFAAYPAQLGSDRRSESESSRRPMGDGRPKIFISHLCSSVSRSASSDIVHPLCAQSYAATLPHFAIVYREEGSGSSHSLPFANAGTIRELMGQLCLARSLARSPLQAEWHRPNMCVRIQFPLTFSSVSVGRPLSLPRGI